MAFWLVFCNLMDFWVWMALFDHFGFSLNRFSSKSVPEVHLAISLTKCIHVGFVLMFMDMKLEPAWANSKKIILDPISCYWKLAWWITNDVIINFSIEGKSERTHEKGWNKLINYENARKVQNMNENARSMQTISQFFSNFGWKERFANLSSHHRKRCGFPKWFMDLSSQTRTHDHELILRVYIQIELLIFSDWQNKLLIFNPIICSSWFSFIRDWYLRARIYPATASTKRKTDFTTGFERSFISETSCFSIRFNVEVYAQFLVFFYYLPLTFFERSFVDKVFKEADKFFTSPIEDKQRYRRKPGKNFGYIGKGVERLVTFNWFCHSSYYFLAPCERF